MARYTLTVNGAPRALEAEPDMPLLWALRDLLGLTGTKYGCGVGSCGSCTVHVGGRAERSCLVTVAEAADRPVTTIEGLSPGGDHPLQRAWLDGDVPQCGYCQAGQIMQAAALLAEHPGPDVAEVDAWMEGNVCRCGTYVRIRAAILRAAWEVRA